MLPFVVALCHVMMPFQLRTIIDLFLHPETKELRGFEPFIEPVVIYVLLSEFLNLAYRSIDIMIIKVMIPLRARARNISYQYLIEHSYRYTQNHLAGELGNKILDVGNVIIKIMEMICNPFLTTLLMVILTITIIAFIHPLTALILTIWSLFFLVFSVLTAFRAKKLSYDFSTASSRYMGKLIDSASNIASIKLFSRQKYEYDSLQEPQDRYIEKNIAMNRYVTKVRWVLGISTTIFQAVTLSILVYAWQEKLISVGSIVFIMTMSLTIATSLFDVATRMLEFFEWIGKFKQSLTIINEPHEVTDREDAGELVVDKGSIEFDNVSFFYKEGQSLFKDKSIRILPGQKVGLVGFSGAGKTTFINLILRFFDIESGVIRIDNQDISMVTQQSLRNNISMIPQDTSLFHRSVMDNIRYGKLDATDEEVIVAAKHAHAHEFIMKLPEGYSSMVGERGIKLSGGQRQRIAIARAMLKSAPILILDEATSALDSMTEKYIQEALKHLTEGRTTIVIAHRLSTLLEMDRILVFDNGVIIEEGSHKQLLDKDGHYAKIWNMQTGSYLPENASKT